MVLPYLLVLQFLAAVLLVLEHFTIVAAVEDTF
jgi:hypothetical protein